MEVHKGELAKGIVKKCGMTITTISEKLGISRNSLYNKFNDPNLSDSFLLKLGETICYDFSICFPKLKQEINEDIDDKKEIIYVDRAVESLLRADKKYIALLEKYNGLLSILIRFTQRDESHNMKNDVSNFLNNSRKNSK